MARTQRGQDPAWPGPSGLTQHGQDPAWPGPSMARTDRSMATTDRSMATTDRSMAGHRKRLWQENKFDCPSGGRLDVTSSMQRLVSSGAAIAQRVTISGRLPRAAHQCVSEGGGRGGRRRLHCRKWPKLVG